MAGNRVLNISGDIKWDEGQIRILLYSPEGEASQEIQRRARAVQRRAQSKAPSRTGQLRSSIHVNTRYPSDGADAEISADAPYALAVEFGRREVTPTQKSILHWQGDYAEVWTLTARAVGAVHFMRDALDEAGD